MTTRRRWIAAVGLWLIAIAAVRFSGVRAIDAPPLVVSTSTLPIAISHNVAVGDHVVASGPDPFLVLTPPPRPVRSIRLLVVPARWARQDFYLYYVPAGAPPDAAFNERDVAPARVTAAVDGWRVEWELARPVRAWRVDVPDDANFRVVSWQASDQAGALHSSAGGVTRSALTFLAAALLVLGGFVLAFSPARPAGIGVETILVGLLAAPMTVIVFLLPPFQGPDESAHWVLALETARGALATEPAAYRLADRLDPVPMRFRPDVKFDAARLGIVTVPAGSASDLQSRLGDLHRNYPYVRRYAYPLATLVMWLYPHVDSVGQGVLLFYLCRLIQAIALLACLVFAVRRCDFLFTAVTFFSLPLVLEQHIVISADILLNLGALTMALLFLHHRRAGGLAAAIALWAIGLAIVSVKFIYAPLLLLPFLTIPPGTARRALVIAAAAALVIGSYPAARIVLHQVRSYAAAVNRAALGEQQIAALATFAGWREVGGQYVQFVASLRHVADWSGPLGWLDTALSDSHVELIAISVALAVVADLWRIAAGWQAWKRSLAPAIAFGAVGLIVATFLDVLLYHLMTTSPGAPVVAGVQVRHFFPVVIPALVLAAPGRPDEASGRAEWLRIFAAAGLSGLLLLRTVLLAQDLLLRYW